MTHTVSHPDLLQSKQHFAILDGLRGVAALAVVVFHFMEITFPNPNENFIAHAYLAVDFFFCLSGFVIAYAYDNRLPAIGTWNFFKLRLIRLHPLVVIGATIGLILFLADPYSDLAAKYGSQVFALFLTACLMIPLPIVGERFFNLFHLNAPTWSLFWEYVANIVYALVLVRVGKKVLWLLFVISAAVMLYESYRSGSLNVGWGGETFAGGAVRVSYSFLAGILVYRSNWIIKTKLGFLPLAILTAAVFMVPFSEKTSAFVDPFLVMICHPLLVALGAGAVLRPAFDKLCRLSGELSYPLYMVHYPFIWVFFSYVLKFKPSTSEMIWIAVGGVVFFILLAYVVMRWIDLPIRKYLRNRLIKKAA